MLKSGLKNLIKLDTNRHILALSYGRKLSKVGHRTYIGQLFSSKPNKPGFSRAFVFNKQV